MLLLELPVLTPGVRAVKLVGLRPPPALKGRSAKASVDTDAVVWPSVVFRIGAAYDVSRRWTVRAGFSYANRTFGSDAVAQNFLSPLDNSTAVSIGTTYRISDKDEISGLFEYGFPVNLHGTGASQGFNVNSKTEVIGISYGHRF